MNAPQDRSRQATPVEWRLARNCSMTPRQVGLAYLVLVLISGSVAGAATLLYGAWQVLCFAVLEMAGMAAALICYARHATDHEHVSLSASELVIERVVASHVQRIRLDPLCTRIAQPKGGGLIGLQARGAQEQIGGFVSLACRRRVAGELRQALERNARLDCRDASAM